MAQGFKVGLDEDSIKRALERFKEVLNDLNTIANGSKINIGMDDVIKVVDVFISKLKSAEQQFKRMDAQDIAKSWTTFQNSFINKQSGQELLDRVQKIRSEVDQLASYDFKLDAKGKMTNAVITYRNNLNQVVKETMGWKDDQETVNGELQKTMKFMTTGFQIGDNMFNTRKLLQSIDNFQKNVETRFNGLKEKYAEVFDNPQAKNAIESSFQKWKSSINDARMNPANFDKNSLNSEWKNIVEQVKRYNDQMKSSSVEQETAYKKVISIQGEINKLQKENLNTDKYTVERNNEKIQKLEKQEQTLTAQLETMNKQKAVAEYLANIKENKEELNKDLSAKEKSVNAKNDDGGKSALSEVLSIQKEINNLQTKNLTTENAKKIRNEERIKNLKEQLDVSTKLLQTDKQREIANKNQSGLDKDLTANETSTLQAQNYEKIKNILGNIQELRKKITNLKIDENDLDSNLVNDLKKQESVINSIKNSKITLSNGTETEAINQEQVNKLTTIEKDNLERIKQLRDQIADKDAYGKSATGGSSTGASLDRFGKQVDTGLNFGSSKEEVEDFLKTFTNGSSKITKFNEQIEKSGSTVKQLEYHAKDADGTMHKYQMTIDKVTNSTRLMDMGMRKLNETHRNFAERIGYAVGKMGEWALSAGLLYGVMNQLRNGIEFINELNDSLTQIGIVTYQNQQQVAGLATQYNNLAKEMRVTTGDVAKASVEFYRQGLSQTQVMERMRTTTQFAKISNLEFAESAKILTATVNSMNVPMEKATDVFAYLGDATATGSDELAQAYMKVGGTANALDLSFEKVSSYIATLSSKTREGSEAIGNAIKSIMLRYQQLKQKGFAEEDGTKVNAVAKALNEVGIQIIDTQGNFRDFTQVMDELGAKWDTLTNRERAYISTQMAGRMSA